MISFICTASNKGLREINNFIHSNLNYYTKIEKKDNNIIILFLNNLKKEYNINIPFDIFIFIRDTYIYFQSKNRGIITNRYGSDIIKSYNNDESILNISKKFNLPPINIFKQILIEKKYESHEIEKILCNKKEIPTEFDNKEIMNILKLNPINWLSKPKINLQYFNKFNCPFKYNKKEKNKPLIVFNKLCIYNNMKINWIEIKNYILFDNKLILIDINKLIKKYSNFGKGLILFNNIICSNTFCKKIKAYIYIL